eukprot:3442862-Amphidinium_carterae.3
MCRTGRRSMYCTKPNTLASTGANEVDGHSAPDEAPPPNVQDSRMPQVASELSLQQQLENSFNS